MACKTCNQTSSNCGCDTTCFGGTSNWLIPVNEVPPIEMASRKFAYMTPDGGIWVANFEGTGMIPLDSDNIDWIVDANEALPPLEEANPLRIYRQDDQMFVVNEDKSDWIDLASGGSSVPQVQADWEVTDEDSKAFIKNKPTIPIPVEQVQTDWEESDEDSKAFIKNKPTIPIPVEQVQVNWEESDTASKAFIENKPFETVNTNDFEVVDDELRLVATPDWLTPVTSLPSVATASPNSAYILPDDSVWTLNYDGTELVEVNNKPSLIDYIVFEGDSTGATDVTADLNSYIGACAAFKKGLYIPGGKYKILGEVNLEDNVNILGAGIGDTVLEFGSVGKINIAKTKEVFGIEISEIEINICCIKDTPIFDISRLHDSRIRDLKIYVFEDAALSTAFYWQNAGANVAYYNDITNISVVSAVNTIVANAVVLENNVNSNHFVNFRTVRVLYPFQITNCNNVVLSECAFEVFETGVFLNSTTGTYINGCRFELGRTGISQDSNCKRDHFVGNLSMTVTTMYTLNGTYQMLDDTQTVADFLRVSSGMLANLDMRGFRLLNTSVANFKLTTTPGTPTAGTSDLFFDGNLKLQKDDGTIVNLTYPNDIPWTNFTTNTGWSGVPGRTRFKVSENVLHLNMTDLRTQTAINANTNYTVATLPVGARPSSKFETFCAHRSGTNILRTGTVTVNIDGTIVVNFTSASTATTGTAYNAIKAFYSIPLN